MTDDTRFWLLAGATPTGPIPLADLHARLADGSGTGKTKVCRVGDAAWVPLFSLPGVGPPAVPEVGVSTHPLPLLGSSLDPPRSLGAAIPGVDQPPVPLDVAKDGYDNPTNLRYSLTACGVLGLKFLPKLLFGLAAVVATVYAVVRGNLKGTAKRTAER